MQSCAGCSWLGHVQHRLLQESGATSEAWPAVTRGLCWITWAVCTLAALGALVPSDICVTLHSHVMRTYKRNPYSIFSHGPIKKAACTGRLEGHFTCSPIPNGKGTLTFKHFYQILKTMLITKISALLKSMYKCATATLAPGEQGPGASSPTPTPAALGITSTWPRRAAPCSQ